jgi:dihydroflavonol-4-reductase
MSSTALNALVLGGSGLIGNAIVRELVAHGHRVTAVGRAREPPANLAGLDVAYLSADLDATGLPEDRLESVGVVVDAAAPYALQMFDRGGERSSVERAERRTEHLLRSLHGRSLRFVYVGTSIRPRRSVPLFGVQNDWARRVHPYFAIKDRVDARVAEAAARGLSTITIRPTFCVGPWDVKPRDKCWIPALIDGQVLITPEHRLNVVDTRDVAKVLVSAVETGYSERELTVVGHNTTVDGLFSLVCESAAVARPMFKAPAALGVLPSMWLEAALAAAGRESPLPSILPILICEQDWVQPGTAQSELGGARRALADTINDAVAWYRRIGYV